MRIKIALIIPEVVVQSTKELLSHVTNHNVDVVEAVSSVEELQKLLRTTHVDCVLYDPLIDDGNLLQTWRDDVGGYPMLICVSWGYAIIHALSAFEAGALHFIVAPMLEQKMRHAMERVIKKLMMYPHGPMNGSTLREGKAPFESKVISLPTTNGLDVRLSEQVIRVQGQGNYTRVVFVKDPAMLVCRCISDYEAIVSEAGFVRVHRSSFVNLIHVRKLLRGKSMRLLMVNGDEVDVSDRYREVLFEALHVVGHRKKILVEQDA